MRWEPTDPIFRRLVMKDVELCGVDDPRRRGRRDEPRRRPTATRRAGTIPTASTRTATPKPNVGFAGGPHVCLGMHVARAEMFVAMNAVLDRLPNLRFDPDAPDVRIIGLEHRGPNGIPVVFG